MDKITEINNLIQERIKIKSSFKKAFRRRFNLSIH